MKGSTKDVLLEHSKVKVELYVKYLSKYLNILKRAGFYNKIHLYDLMCGEGVYSDNSKGSPVVALETIKEHYYTNGKSCINTDVWFNDFGLSDVEKGKTKIERVNTACNDVFKPSNVNVKYTNLDFVSDIYPKLLEKIKTLKNEKLLLFLDPYGYKDITPNHIKNLLCSKHIELLLFVPITPMYRFANKSLSDKDFRGGESLRQILKVLLNDEYKVFKNERDFITTLKNKYFEYLNNEYYVDTFTIQRNKSNTYALFFFTPHIKGFETMLRTKWEMDEKNGIGFKIDSSQMSLFEDISFSEYPEKLKKYIKEGKGKINNKDLYVFGLKNGYLPTHTVKVFKRWQKDIKTFNVLDNGEKARGFYISYDYYINKKNKIVTYTI